MDGKDMAAEANGKVPECDVTPGEPESKLASKESFWHIDRTMLRFKIHFFLYIGDYIIRKVGHYQVLSFSLLLYVARCLWYSYLYNPWLVLPIELCHGVTYGLYYTTLASYGKLSAKPGTEATTQSVVFSTHEGLGAGLGCVFGGLGFDYLGGHQTFRIAGIFCACGFLVSLVLFFFIRKENSQWERPASDTSA